MANSLSVAEQMALQINDKILDIGNKGFAAQTASVFKLVYHKFRDVNGVEVDRPDHAAHQLVRGCHIAGRDGVKLGCETDDGGCPARISPHGVLGFIDIGIDARQRAVVTDRAGQYQGNVLFQTGVNNAVADVIVMDQVFKRSGGAGTVNGFDMMVMAVFTAAF